MQVPDYFCLRQITDGFPADAIDKDSKGTPMARL